MEKSIGFRFGSQAKPDGLTGPLLATKTLRPASSLPDYP